MGHNTMPDPKAVTLKPNDGVSSFKVLMTPVNADGNETLGKAGFSDQTMIFTLLEGKPLYSTYDPHMFGNNVNCEAVKHFLVSVRRELLGFDYEDYGFSELEDGGTYYIGDC